MGAASLTIRHAELLQPEMQRAATWRPFLYLHHPVYLLMRRLDKDCAIEANTDVSSLAVVTL